MALPTVDEIARYAANPAYTLTCRETHIQWAMSQAIEADDWDAVNAFARIKRGLYNVTHPW